MVRILREAARPKEIFPLIRIGVDINQIPDRFKRRWTRIVMNDRIYNYCYHQIPQNHDIPLDRAHQIGSGWIGSDWIVLGPYWPLLILIGPCQLVWVLVSALQV